MADFDASPAHIEILLPLGGKHILSSEPPNVHLGNCPNFRDVQEPKRKDSPKPSPSPSATPCAVFSKLGLASLVLEQRKKRPLQASDGLDGSGFRAKMKKGVTKQG
jgi:hypothetical protein